MHRLYLICFILAIIFSSFAAYNIDVHTFVKRMPEKNLVGWLSNFHMNDIENPVIIPEILARKERMIELLIERFKGINYKHKKISDVHFISR